MKPEKTVKCEESRHFCDSATIFSGDRECDQRPQRVPSVGKRSCSAVLVFAKGPSVEASMSGEILRSTITFAESLTLSLLTCLLFSFSMMLLSITVIIPKNVIEKLQL